MGWWIRNPNFCPVSSIFSVQLVALNLQQNNIQNSSEEKEMCTFCIATSKFDRYTSLLFFFFNIKQVVLY